MKNNYFNISFVYVLFLLFSFSYGINVALLDFEDVTPDNESHSYQEFSNEFSENLSDILTSDLSKAAVIDFYPRKQLNRELKLVRSNLFKSLRKELDKSIIRTIDDREINKIIANASNKEFSPQKISILRNHLKNSIFSVTKHITKDILSVNKLTDDGLSELNIGDIHDFIANVTDDWVSTSTFPGFIASSGKTEFSIFGRYKIKDDQILMKIEIYDMADFSLYKEMNISGNVSAPNIIVKEIEYKILKSFGHELNDFQKLFLCKFDTSLYDKKKGTFYFSDNLVVSNIDTLAAKLNILDIEKFKISFIKNFISDIKSLDLSYKLKFSDEDNLYKVYSTGAVGDDSFMINVLKNKWSSSPRFSSNEEGQMESNRGSEMLVKINYSDIEQISFVKEKNNLLKNITIYGFITAVGYLISVWAL